jgi:hypothetical protein
MKQGIRWFLIVAALALAPTVVQAWEYGPRLERLRLHNALRQGWCETVRETHRAIMQTRREIRRARLEQRAAVREAYRLALRTAREARRYLRW